MSQRYYGDRWYKVTVVNGSVEEVVVGQYANAPNAVFGAMRKLKLDNTQKATIEVELLPSKPRGMTKAAYTRHLRAIHGA